MHRDGPIGKGVFQPLGGHVALEGRTVPGLPVVNSRGDLHGLYDDWLLAVFGHAHSVLYRMESAPIAGAEVYKCRDRKIHLTVIRVLYLSWRRQLSPAVVARN